MSEPVTNAYKLPPEVIALLGDDATPEKAAANFDSVSASDCAISSTASDYYRSMFALVAWRSALAAAAIRECEARRDFLSKSPNDADATAAWTQLREAAAAYDALRNWRQR